MTDIARNIKHTRLARGMNQEQLAEALGVTRQTVSNWERSASNPDLATLERIAAALQTDTAGLIYGVGQSTKLAGSPALRALACALLYAILLCFGGLVFVYIMMKFFVLGGSGIGVSTVTDGFILWGLILLAGFMAARPFEGGK